MAMRECLSSAARYQARVSADAILERPSGSKTLPPVSTPTPSLRKERRRQLSSRHAGRCTISQAASSATAHMSATPMRTDERALLTTPAGATYEVAERGGEHAEEETRTRRFDTASARGVTTFDARTCEAIEFVPIDAWSRDKANFEKLRSMRTFRLHRLWKAFATMRAHARRRKFRRARAV